MSSKEKKDMTEKETKEVKQSEKQEPLVHIDDYLEFYSDLHTISKTSMRMNVNSRLFRTVAQWQELEKEYK